MTKLNIKTPFLPRFNKARRLLRILEDVPESQVSALLKALANLTGTPQSPVDWSDPDSWIEDRLDGKARDLARKIWTESKSEVNPRYTKTPYSFFKRMSFIETGAKKALAVTKRGQDFLACNEALIRNLDTVEGTLYALQLVSTKARATRSELLPDWKTFLQKHSDYQTDSSSKSTLWSRLRNLIERGYIKKEGNANVITSEGKKYLNAAPTASKVDPRQEVLKAAATYNAKQRKTLKSYLATMDPFAFEHLIGKLLEAMGYEDVVVTKQSGDKGIDVVATIQFGITTIKEVVQVKRQQANVGRPIIDQLRGALVYQKAIRGTIITLGGFSGGCTEAALFPGAAPITLIDGDKLLDLFFDHELGVKKNPVALFDFDPDLLKIKDSDTTDDAAEA